MSVVRLIVITATLSSLSAQTAPRLMTAKDTLNLASVGSPAISPDDQWVLYTRTVRDWDEAQWRQRTQIWRVRIDGTGARQLTFGNDNATAPAWFPDGSKIAFLSSRGQAAASGGSGGPGGPGGPAAGGEAGGTQVFFMHTDGGEAWQATKHETAVAGFSISPDGRKLLLTAQDPLTAEDRRRQRERDDPEVVDEAFRWTHLWAFDIESGKSSRITDGKFVASEAQWAPDSARIAFVARPTTKVDDAALSDVWVTDLDGKSRRFYENAGPDTSPRWSPDGRTLAMASRTQVGNTQWYDKLYLFPAEGGKPRVLLQDFDLAFGNPIWSRDGKIVYWSTGQGTKIALFGVDVSTGELTTTGAPMGGANGAWQLAHRNDAWVFTHSDGLRSGDLWAARRQASGFATPVRLTNANAWVEAEKLQLGAVETIRWPNSEGGIIEGVLTRPVGYRAGSRYPLIVNPHGGPSGASIESFSGANQMFAANGFLVLEINFRGSSNYGQKHLNANRNNWGVGDYDDIMTGVDYLIKQGWADPARMVAYGWSYGGYMTFWMSTQTDRFKLISPGAGLTNLYSMYSTTDIPAYIGWFFGTPWENPDIYQKLSPIQYAKNVKAKILIMHGANDARVPPTQADEFYKALKDLGKDVTYVRYPRQGHGITEPRLALDRLRRYVCAFTDVLKMAATTEACNGPVPAAPPAKGEAAGKGEDELGADPGTFDGPGAQAAAAPQAAAQAPAPAFDQEAALAELQRAIAGREELPATEVFKNITQYKGVTAGRLLRIMELGFSRSLGVTCTHCHVAGEWASEEKSTKAIAREMSRMVSAINGELLKKIPNLRSTNPSVNCTTCHRGQTRPALDLPQAARIGGAGVQR